MARSRNRIATAEAPPNGDGIPSDDDKEVTGPAEGEVPPETNGHPKSDKRRPVVSFKFPVDRSTTIEVALWPNTIRLSDGKEVEVLAATISRSYKDANDQYVKNGSYRVHDLPIVAHALMRAHAFAIDQRELGPF